MEVLKRDENRVVKENERLNRSLSVTNRKIVGKEFQKENYSFMLRKIKIDETVRMRKGIVLDNQQDLLEQQLKYNESRMDKEHTESKMVSNALKVVEESLHIAKKDRSEFHRDIQTVANQKKVIELAEDALKINKHLEIKRPTAISKARKLSLNSNVTISSTRAERIQNDVRLILVY